MTFKQFVNEERESFLQQQLPEFAPKSNKQLFCPDCGKKEIDFNEGPNGKIIVFCNYCNKQVKMA